MSAVVCGTGSTKRVSCDDTPELPHLTFRQLLPEFWGWESHLLEEQEFSLARYLPELVVQLIGTVCFLGRN